MEFNTYITDAEWEVMRVVWENKNTSNLVEAWSNKVSMDDACKKAATDMNELLSQE